VEASSHFVDMRLQRFMGHLPMLFTEHPSKAVNIGLGCGITLGAVSVHPIEKLHCVELEVKITETCRYFAEYNHEVMDHPRLDVIINDGRNHLLLTDHQYDVITSDPFEPLVGGAANLYTLEHFENGRARLTPGGIFCQYLPMYQLAPEDFQMIIRTFCKVYPHVSLWYTGIDTILLGSEDPHEVSLESLTDRFRTEAVRTSLEDVGVANPVHLLQTFVMDPKKIPDIVGSGRLNTDRNPYIEYSAPRSHLMNTTAMNLAWLLRNYHPENLPLDTSTEGARAAAAQAAEQGRWVMEAALARFEGDFLRSLEASRRAVALDPENRTSLYELTAAANLHALRLLDQGEADAAKALLDEGFAGGEELLTTYVNYATWAFKTGDFPAAQDFLEKAHELNPQVPENTLKMAICSSQMGDLKEAERWCDEALDLNPRFRRARLLKADILRKRGDSAGALALYEEILEKDPIRAVAPDWIQVGDLYVKERAPTKAKRAYENATSADASNFVGWYKLARTAHLLGDRRTASDALNRAWRLKPSLVEQWVGTDPTLRDTGYLNLPVFAAPQEQGQPSSQGAPSAGQP